MLELPAAVGRQLGILGMLLTALDVGIRCADREADFLTREPGLPGESAKNPACVTGY
ncbi:hypothetical protein SBA1_530074 [Candidatus Sulfotelmatobacter kueseliae]|uniref:Uncharacterized protein n=1 Tax=Candidatus Sulfotelmatobacter kueseliae TaxID=2042962 RepID=A0A2U3KXS7_9BACT|nr:hypothetical protein SBA1_530074 [Candidatus Sulfotelmatobacter kueseliae]